MYLLKKLFFGLLLVIAVFTIQPTYASWVIDTTPPICEITFPGGYVLLDTTGNSDLFSLTLSSPSPSPAPIPTGLPITTTNNSLTFNWTAVAGRIFYGTPIDSSGNSGSCFASYGAPWLQVIGGDVHSNR